MLYQIVHPFQFGVYLFCVGERLNRYPQEIKFIVF